MAREIFVNGVQFTEEGEEEYFIWGLQVNEDQPAAGDGIFPGPISLKMFQSLIITGTKFNIFDVSVIGKY